MNARWKSPQVVLTARDRRSASVMLGPQRPQLPTRLWKLDALGARYAPQVGIDWLVELCTQTDAVDLAAMTRVGNVGRRAAPGTCHPPAERD